MCFSAQADLLGGLVVGAIGVDAVRHVGVRRNYWALAALPLLFAGHQIVEAFVWWGLQGDVSAGVGRAATLLYLVFAFVLLPIYVPAAIYLIEPRGVRQWTIAPFMVLGAVVSAVLLAAMIRGPVVAELGQFHISYSTGLSSGWVVVVAYVIATCGAALLSGYRDVAMFGVVNLIAVAALARLTIDGFASLWCAWAAITSGAIAVYIRFGRPHRSAGLELS